MAAKPHFAASVQSKKGRLYAVMQVKKDGTTKPVWRALGLSEGANKTKVNKAFREVVAQYEQEFWEEQERGGRPPADIPVYDYLVSYLKRVEPELQKNTIVSYRSMTNGKIRRYFQRRPQLTVGNLKPQDIQDFYQSLFADGVAANTVIHYHALLRRAFQQAFKEERIDANPFDRVGRPKKNKFHGENYTQEELLTLLHLARGDVIYPAILLAGAMGLRRSEALGVRWSRIDWEKRTVLLDTKIVEYREKEGGAGGGDEEQIQPPHPASPRPGGGDAPGAERAPGGVPEDVPRQLQRPIPGLCVRQPTGGAAAPQLCHRPLPGAAGEVRPAAHPLPRPAPPVCQAHDKKYNSEKQKTQTTNYFDSLGFLFSFNSLSLTKLKINISANQKSS